MKRCSSISIICTLLIILWVYAAMVKLIHYRVFTDQLQRQPFPSWSVHILAWVLPLLELSAAGLLCYGKSLRSGLLLSAVLLFAFTIYVALGLAHVYAHVPCSCGGILGSMGWGMHLAFNIVFTLAAVSAFFSLTKRQKNSAGEQK